MTGTDTDVIVIGAGISGLSAARRGSPPPVSTSSSWKHANASEVGCSP